MILDPQVEAEKYAPPPPPAPPRRLPPQRPALAVLLYGDCAQCGLRQSLRLDGTIRRHYQHDGDGRETGDQHCPGSLHKPASGLFTADGVS